MSAVQLTETVRNMVLQQVKSNIAGELAAIRADRNSPTVNVQNPKSYFIYETDLTYQCPAIFLVVDSGDNMTERGGSNHLQAKIKMYCSAVIEEQQADKLTILSERYQAALMACLNEVKLQSDSLDVLVWVYVRRFEFSPLYTRTRKKENMGDFRKEVSLELEVQLWENPTT